MSTVVISLKQVSKEYGLYESPAQRAIEALSIMGNKRHKTHSALKEISLDIKEGEIVGIVGRNGCGKSTFLKLVAGILHPTSGNIEVNGKVTALLELGAGFNPEFTGIENIFFYGAILGMEEEQIKKRLDQIIEFADIGEYINQPIKTYSSGMRSRLSFSVAIHVDPEILILDEVLSVGDVLFKRKCYARMEELFSSGKTIIYVSHDANSVRQLCTRALLLHESRVVMDGEPAEVTKYYEKLVFSSVDHHKAILNEMAGMGSVASLDVIDESLPLPQKGPKHFISSLEPTSKLVYGSGDAFIESSYFQNQQGDVVNVLSQGEFYQYVYHVVFKNDCQNVTFNFMVKTLDGVKVSGVSQHKNRKNVIKEVSESSKLKVVWNFECSLTKGDYFTNIGVVTTESGDRDFLMRVVDADVFRVVIPEEKNVISGMVDLKQTCRVEVLR